MNYKTKLLIKIFPSSIKHVHGSRGDLLVHDIALNYTHYDQSFLQFKLKKITEYNFALVHPNHTLSCSSQTARMKENTHNNTYIYTNRTCNIIKTGYNVDPMSWYGPPLYERRRKICFCLVWWLCTSWWIIWRVSEWIWRCKCIAKHLKLNQYVKCYDIWGQNHTYKYLTRLFFIL